jgi:hypothetical protein
MGKKEEEEDKKKKKIKKWEKNKNRKKNEKKIKKKERTAQHFTMNLHNKTLFSFFLILFAISPIFILLLVKFTLSREK